MNFQETCDHLCHLIDSGLENELCTYFTTYYYTCSSEEQHELLRLSYTYLYCSDLCMAIQDMFGSE